MGAGITPISKFRNKIYILLGKERFNGEWSDFGGSSHLNENHLQTAIREGYEELDGFLGNKQTFKNLVIKNYITSIENNYNGNYKSFVTKFKYDSKLPLYFNNHHKFVENKTKNLCGNDGLYEKSHIKWFTIYEMKSLVNVRPHFKYIISEIILMENYLLDIL